MSKVSNKLAVGMRKVKDQESKPRATQAGVRKVAATGTTKATQAERKVEAGNTTKVSRLATERIWPD
jgi:hypothetical protein